MDVPEALEALQAEVHFATHDDGRPKDQPLSWHDLFQADIKFYVADEAEQAVTKERIAETRNLRPMNTFHWMEACSIREISKYTSLRFASVGDTRITDCGVLGSNGLYSRVQIKSAFLPNDGERMIVKVNVPKDGRYDGMLILLVVHRPVPDEERIKFKADMDEDPFHLPDFESVYVYCFRKVNDIPGRVISFSDKAQQKWLPFRYEIKKPEDAARLEVEVNEFMQDDARKLKFDELMLEEDGRMNETSKTEHRLFTVQYKAFQDIGWTVLPNPRKHEACDVFIIRPDGRVFLVSNKCVTFHDPKYPSYRFFNTKGFHDHLLSFIFAIEDGKTAYIVLPEQLKDGTKNFFFTDRNPPGFVESGIDITTDAGKHKLEERLNNVETPYTVDDLEAFEWLVPFNYLV